MEPDWIICNVCPIPRIGSAIVVDVQTSSSVFSELVYNPQCFLIHEDATLPPSQWTQVRKTIKLKINNLSYCPIHLFFPSPSSPPSSIFLSLSLSFSLYSISSARGQSSSQVTLQTLDLLCSSPTYSIAPGSPFSQIIPAQITSIHETFPTG